MFWWFAVTSWGRPFSIRHPDGNPESLGTDGGWSEGSALRRSGARARKAVLARAGNQVEATHDASAHAELPALLVTVKRAPLDPAAQAGAVASGLRFAASLRPDAMPPVPRGIFGTMRDWLDAIRFRVRYLRHLPRGTRFAFLANSIRRRSGAKPP